MEKVEHFCVVKVGLGENLLELFIDPLQGLELRLQEVSVRSGLRVVLLRLSLFFGVEEVAIGGDPFVHALPQSLPMLFEDSLEVSHDSVK